MDRFVLDGVVSGDRAVLSPAESHHLLTVMRYGIGDEVELRERAGRRFRARVARREGERAVLEIIEELPAPRQALPALLLAQAILKGKRMDILVEKAVELGASRIIPLVTSRTVVRLDGRIGQKCLRWARKMTAALAQSGCAASAKLDAPMRFEEFISNPPAHDLACIAALTADAQPLSHVLRGASGASSILFIVGPEGDFTGGELDLARRAGCAFVTLAPHVLRAETAGIAALAGALYEFCARA